LKTQKQKYSDLKKEKKEGIKTQEKGELKKRKKKNSKCLVLESDIKM
jgi:hypothetical protein